MTLVVCLLNRDLLRFRQTTGSYGFKSIGSTALVVANSIEFL